MTANILIQIIYIFVIISCIQSWAQSQELIRKRDDLNQQIVAKVERISLKDFGIERQTKREIERQSPLQREIESNKEIGGQTPNARADPSIDRTIGSHNQRYWEDSQSLSRRESYDPSTRRQISSPIDWSSSTQRVGLSFGSNSSSRRAYNISLDSIHRPSKQMKNCSQSCVQSRYLQHYYVKSCQPLYDTECQCPTAFLCISRPVNTSVCEYEGRIYGVGSRIPVKNVCRMCECRDFGRTTREVSAQIDCGIGVECPEEAFGLKPQPNCYFAYERDRCCGQQVCENPLHPKKSTKVCTYKGRRYRLGEKIYPEEDNCKICYCNEDWSDTDPLNSLSCRTHSCDLQLDKDFVSGCLPVYHESSCCPIEYKCPKTVVSSARTSDSKSCWFDGRQYSRGQQMPTDNPCVECVCRTPPEMTCIQKSCPTPPHNCYVGKWDNSVCCQHYTCQPRDHIRDESQFRHNFYSNS